MLGLKTDQEVLGELVKVKVPAVWQAMVEHNVMWTLVVSRWFICLFIDVLPVEVRVQRSRPMRVKHKMGSGCRGDVRRAVDICILCKRTTINTSCLKVTMTLCANYASNFR